MSYNCGSVLIVNMENLGATLPTTWLESGICGRYMRSRSRGDEILDSWGLQIYSEDDEVCSAFTKCLLPVVPVIVEVVTQFF